MCVIKNHPNVLRLKRNLLQIFEDLGRCEAVVQGITNSTHSREDISNERDFKNSYAKSAKSLRNCSGVKSPVVNYLFESHDFKKVVIFSYLYYVITVANSDLFNMIEAKSKLLIDAVDDNKICDRAKWERCQKEWKKVMQLLSHKAKVRWEKILSNSVTSLEEDFTEVILKAIMSNSINLPKLFESPCESIA
jgi:hypothetical protein